jgi:hypothetical protein
MKDNFAIVLVYRDEEGDWIAHCLDFSLLAHARKPRDAIKKLIGVMIAHIEYLEKNDLMDQLYAFPAPREYWEKLREAEPIGTIRINKRVKPRKISDVVPAIHEMSRINVEYGLASS